jgi:hypothetical protein
MTITTTAYTNTALLSLLASDGVDSNGAAVVAGSRSITYVESVVGEIDNPVPDVLDGTHQPLVLDLSRAPGQTVDLSQFTNLHYVIEQGSDTFTDVSANLTIVLTNGGGDPTIVNPISGIVTILADADGETIIDTGGAASDLNVTLNANSSSTCLNPKRATTQSTSSVILAKSMSQPVASATSPSKALIQV